jgi:hypothetical protein
MSIHPTADLGASWTPFSCFEAPTHDPLSPLSVSIYAANALVMLAMDVAIWPYALARSHLLAESTPPDYPTRMMRYSLQIAALFSVSIAAAWFAPRAALYVWATFPPIVVLQARGLSRVSATRQS